MLCPNNDGSLCSVAGPSSPKATTAPTVAASTRRAPLARPPPKSGLLEQAATKLLLRPSSSSRLKTNIAPTIPPRSRPRPTASPTAPSPHQTPASDSQAQHLRPVFTKQPDHQATVKATNPTPRASTHGLALTTATAHARQLVSRPHTGRPPGPTCPPRASVADKSINVILWTDIMLPLDSCRSGRPLSHRGGVPDVYSGLLSQSQRVHGRSLPPAFAAAVASVRLHFAFSRDAGNK